MLILDKTGVGAGASGIACGVVRNNYFQPAMSELMAANVEVWEQDPRGFSYHAGRLLRPRQRRTGRRPDRGARAPAADRVSVGADRRRRGRAQAHAHDVPGLAGAGRRGVPARGEGRLRQQHGLDAGPRGQGARGRSAARRRRARDRIRHGRLRRRSDGAHRPGRHRRRAGGGRRRPLGGDDLGDAGAARSPRRAHARGRRPPRSAHVDVLVPPGGRDLGRPQAALAARRVDAARAARRLRRARSTTTTAR